MITYSSLKLENDNLEKETNYGSVKRLLTMQPKNGFAKVFGKSNELFSKQG